MLRAFKRIVICALGIFGFSAVKNPAGGYSLISNAEFARRRRRETEEWVTREEAKLEARRREADAWVAIQEDKILALRREAEAWVSIENGILVQRQKADTWVATDKAALKPGMCSATVPAPLAIARVDLSLDNPIPDILNAPEFTAVIAAATKTAAAKQSMISAASMALIYTMVRNVKPLHIVEIGIYNGGTSELICQALHENGRGTLHSVGPFDRQRVVPFLASWPIELRRRLQFYPMTSMAFYYEMAARGIRPDIAFIDGDHSYEAVLFDIQSLAKALVRRGFVIVDNVSQAGPYGATMDFLKNNPDWTRCVAREPRWADPTKEFDRERTSVPETDFEILRAPFGYRVTATPMTFGEFATGMKIAGLQLDAETGGGTLHAQCVLRGFGESMAEQVATGAIAIDRPGPVELWFREPVTIKGSFLHCSAEPWLVWSGQTPLCIAGVPRLIGDPPLIRGLHSQAQGES